MYITGLLTLQNQLRIFHWQTTSFAEHQAFGEAYTALDPLIDSFIETMMGKKGRIIASGGFKIDLANYREADPMTFLKKYDAFLSALDSELTEADTELKNIRDDMKGVVNHTLYLLTLNK
jgi:DNA-binding ferritin-like protein